MNASRVAFAVGSIAAVLVACSGKGTPTATTAAERARGAWCQHVPLTASPAGDRTRFDNTAERVIPIKNEIQVEALGCGAYYVGVSYDPIMSAVINGQAPPDNPGFVDPSDTSHCIMIYLKSDAPNPVKNPLYLDGVRVYFVNDAIRATVSAASDQKASWCKDVPFSSDARTDRTGTGNDELRVRRIVKAVEQLVSACPGVSGFAWQLNDTALDELRGTGTFAAQAGGQVAKSWVFRVYVRDAKDMPDTNPLYLDGVRTYFSVIRKEAAPEEDAGAASDAVPMSDPPDAGPPKRDGGL